MPLRLIQGIACALAALTALGAPAADLKVEAARANVRQGPALANAIVGVLARGELVRPLQIRRNYVEVSYGEAPRRQGWIYFPAQGWSPAQLRAEVGTPTPTTVATQSPAAAVDRVPPPAATVGADARPRPREADRAWTSLAELGFKRGWMFEGLASGHRQVFRFPLPRQAGVAAARLRLGFRAVTGLSAPSVIRIDVNGQPLFSRSLVDASGLQWVDLPLSPRLLAATPSMVEVVVRASLIVSEERCREDRATASYLHIDADSGLRLDLTTAAVGALGAWEMLPQRVQLSLPVKPDENTFASALVLVRQLGREGKAVDLVRLPQLGDVVVAPAAEADAALRLAGAPVATDPANLRVATLGERQVLLFSGQPPAWPVGIVDSGWLPVVRGSQHTVGAVQPVLREAPATAANEVSLARLGADLSTRDVVGSAQWSVPLGVDRVPPGKRPVRVDLFVTSAPVPEAQPMMLYAYLNEELQDVARLQGGSEQLSMHLSKSALRGAFNNLRLVVARDPREGNCQAASTGYPVHIGAGSRIAFEDDRSAALDFGELPRVFATGVDLWLSRDLLNRPAAALGFVANLLNANQYPLDPARIHFADDAKPAAASGPFIRIGDQAPGVTGAQVRFDQGPVRVSGPDGQVLLEVDRVEDLAVAQLVEMAGQQGLWVRPPKDADLPAATELGLAFDRVAFIDAKGVALTLPAEHSDLLRTEYPRHRSWFDIFGSYRYWWMALAWIVVIVVLAQIFVKVRAHRRSA